MTANTSDIAPAPDGAGAASSFRLLDLPPELVEHIFDTFTEETRGALLNIRQVSRACRDLSLNAFGARFFEDVVAILHPLSLSILLEIANHSQISYHVKEVTISGECIGGVIDMLGDKNEEHLKDQQRSMEKSGLDQSILTEVFAKLPRLQGVHIDNESYRCEPLMFDGARCGLRHIFSGPTKFDLDSPQFGTNRAFSVVLNGLQTAGLAGRIKLHLFPNVENEQSQRTIFFDPTSVDWKDDLSPSVETLELETEASTRWCLDLIQSVRNIDKFAVKYVVDPIAFSHPDTGLFRWSRLRYLELQSICCNGQSLADFLHAHKDTIGDLTLVTVEISPGTWRNALQTSLEMPKIYLLELSDPAQTTAPSPLDATFEGLSDIKRPDVHAFKLYNKPVIDLMIRALLSDLRTTSWDCEADHFLGALYKLDMRLARAVLDDKAEVRDRCRHLLV